MNHQHAAAQRFQNMNQQLIANTNNLYQQLAWNTPIQYQEHVYLYWIKTTGVSGGYLYKRFSKDIITGICDYCRNPFDTSLLTRGWTLISLNTNHRMLCAVCEDCQKAKCNDPREYKCSGAVGRHFHCFRCETVYMLKREYECEPLTWNYLCHRCHAFDYTFATVYQFPVDNIRMAFTWHCLSEVVEASDTFYLILEYVLHDDRVIPSDALVLC